MARNLLERCPAIECVPCARISADICLVYYCLVDLYRQTQIKKDRPNNNFGRLWDRSLIIL